jgi:hypothetical protein
MQFMRRIFLSAIPLLSSVIVHAQAAMTNTGNLRIHTGANIAAFGSMRNTSTAALVNDGTFYISGNVTNDEAAMSPGTGTVHLNGTTLQSINGTQAFKVYNLTTNNSAGFTLDNDISVTAAHTFTSGLITSSATPNYLVYENGATHSGSSDNAHINGWVRKIGSTNFTFPVGNATFLRPIAISNLSASSVFNAQYAGVTSNTSNVAAPLVAVDPYEYWLVNQVSGGTAQIDMSWDFSKVTFPQYPLTSIRAASYAGGFWTNQGGSATGDVTTTGSITSSSVGTFGAFTFGSLNMSLPLNFIGITATRKNNYSIVKWNTEEEFDVDHLEVERKDSRNTTFFFIASVPAKNGLINQYEIEDHLPLDGIAFYRVKSVDRDGKYSYSKIVAVTDKGYGAMAVINNPARNTIFISVNAVPKGNYNYELIDASGKIIQTGNIRLEGQTVIDIPLSVKTIKGFYLIRVRNSLFAFADKVIIQ